MLGRWTGPGTSNTIPRVSEVNNAQNVIASSRFVQKGSYLRLKNIQLGYTLPVKVLNKISAQSLRVYVGSQNLFTVTKYKEGLDPEIGIDSNIGRNNSPLDIGIDRGIYPQARSLTIGMNLTF